MKLAQVLGLTAVAVAVDAAAVVGAGAAGLRDSGLEVATPRMPYSEMSQLLGGERRLIELEGGVQKWMTEGEKLGLIRERIHFMDITDAQDLGVNAVAGTAAKSYSYPSKVQYKDEVKKLLPALDASIMRTHLESFTSNYNRYYNSDNGRKSSEWLLSSLNSTIAASKNSTNVTVSPFPHRFPQSSNIVSIPGKSNRTIVIGAHQDSINAWAPFLAAPGADDDGSGTVTIWEALRVLLTNSSIANGSAENTLEFHFYAAEEGGLLGSQDVFSAYASDGRDVAAMLQQDMTGYTAGTLAAGKPEAVGVITDFVDPDLTAFLKKVIEAYCEIPWRETKCGYACSDHASASKAGYQSAFIIESEFADSNQRIHGTGDTLDQLDFGHMLQHARLTLGVAYELAYHKF